MMVSARKENKPPERAAKSPPATLSMRSNGPSLMLSLSTT